MKHPKMKKQLVRSLFCLAAGMGLTACVDDSYDLSKDIDMTVQLGTEGLQVKLGNTERIFLSDILEIEDEEMVEETNQGLYYLIEDGQTDFNFDIPTIRTQIDIASLIPSTKIFDFEEYVSLLPVLPDEVEIPADQKISTVSPIGTNEVFKFEQKDIPVEVKSIKRIMPSDRTKTFRITLNITTNDNDRLAFVLDEIKDFKVVLPYFIKCVSPSDGVVIDGNQLILKDMVNINSKSVDLGSFELEAIEAKGDMGLEVKEENGERTLSISDEIGFEGNFSIKTNRTFVAKKGDYANVEFDMVLDGQQSEDMVDIVIDKVTGIYNPVIDPKVDPIDISSELPDFLDDEDVVMDVSNPTIRFDINMQQIPTDINFYSDLTAHKGNQLISQVRVPEAGVGLLNGNAKNTLYFYQGSEPFDPNGKVEGSKLFQVKNLSSLVKKIPDEIRVDLSQGHIELKQDELQTIELGKNYAASADYTVYVPFQFNRGLKVVYNDSTDSFKDDLEDYEAKGAQVSAKIVSTIPLALVASAVPYDKAGREIKGIHISKADVPAAGNDGKEIEKEIQLEVLLDNPKDLKILDRVKFRIEAGAGEQGGTLNSKQYIEVKDVRIRLTGGVIADLN